MFRCIAACLCALGLLLPKAAAAQASSSDPSENARFQYGALRFTPFLAITEIGVDTNVFNAPNKTAKDALAAVIPQLDQILQGQ